MFAGLRSNDLLAKLNFLSLMLALFGGTASLPHILIRYYTVKDQAAVRKSTVVGIASIGCFYILTLFMGLGAMTSGAIDPTDSNMAAPLLARSFGQLLFALISAIAFTTVLGTVSGLIVAASGAVVHDLLGGALRLSLADTAKVRIGRIVAVVVGLIAIGLGILFANMNVSFLVGWAFNVAASANLPALTMLLFWQRDHAAGHHGGRDRRHGEFAGLDPGQRRGLWRRLRLGPRECPGALQSARHRDDPARLPHAGRRVAPDAAEAGQLGRFRPPVLAHRFLTSGLRAALAGRWCLGRGCFRIERARRRERPCAWQAAVL